MCDKRKKVLVLSSTYQRYKEDLQYKNFFVPILTRGLSKYFNISVLAPLDKGSKKTEMLDGIRIYRHRQGLFRKSGLAYGSGILPNIRNNASLWMMVPFFMINQFILMLRIIRKERPDVLFAHWSIPQGFLAAFYKRYINKNIKVLVDAHGADILGDDYSIAEKIMKRVIVFTMNNCDELVTGSTFIRDIMIRLGFLGQIHVFPMGVDTDYFTPGKRDESIRIKFGITGPMIVFVGSIIERKGVHYLIECIPAAVKRFPDIRFVLIGAGNLAIEMKKRAEVLGVEKNLLFTGFADEQTKAKFLATADIFVFPSLSEGFGIVNVEAMSSGTIPVVSDLPVFKDIIEDGKTGFMVEQKNSKALSDIVIKILENPKEYSNIGIEARSFVQKHFDWKSVINKFKNIIES